MRGLLAGTALFSLVAGCSEYGLSRYVEPDGDTVETPGADSPDADTPDDPAGGDPETDPAPTEDPDPFVPPEEWDLCAMPGLMFPVLDHWEAANPPTTLTVLVSEGSVLIEEGEGPITVDVQGVAPQSAGLVWSGDHLVVDYIAAFGVEITVSVPPEVERVEVGVCVGEAMLRGLHAETFALVELGELWGEDLHSAVVDVRNPLGETGLTFATAPVTVTVDGGEGDTHIDLPAATCDCDLQVSGVGDTQLQDIQQDTAAAVEVTAHRTVGSITVQGQP